MNWNLLDLVDGYSKVARHVLEFGDEHAPRGQRTKEILGARINIASPYLSLPLGVGRGLNPGIGIAEALQLIAGESHPEFMVEHFPNFKMFTDGGTWFHGAYGPRIKRQIPKVIENLHSDYSSRQALVTIWDPAYDGYGDVKDTPCTISLQFFIRDNLLHMVTYMRSNDIWWGLPYDCYQFTMLQANLAHVLGCGVGHYTHNVGSLHLYERDWDKVGDLATSIPFEDKQSLVFQLMGTTWEAKVATAHRLLTDTHPANLAEYELVSKLRGREL